MNRLAAWWLAAAALLAAFLVVAIVGPLRGWGGPFDTISPIPLPWAWFVGIAFLVVAARATLMLGGPRAGRDDPSSVAAESEKDD